MSSQYIVYVCEIVKEEEEEGTVSLLTRVGHTWWQQEETSDRR